MFTKDEFSLAPVNFFQMAWDCPFLKYESKNSFPKLAKEKNEKYLLPDTSVLCHENSFAKVAMGWNLEGIEVLVDVNRPLGQVFYPNMMQGDSVELMIDTRDVKTSGFNTRFCHHFFFLPEAIDGVQAGELTHFRTEDTHDLCDSNDLKVKIKQSVKGFVYHIFIPRECLHGYDPEQFDRLGFTYRINRFKGEPQHFSVVTKDYQIEQQPSLWSSINLSR